MVRIFRSLEFDGILIPLVVPDGNGGTLHLGAAWVPSESGNAILFVLRNMIGWGFNFDEFPMFTGKSTGIAAAVRTLAKENIIVSVKLCLEHLYRNVCNKNAIKEDSDRSVVRNALGRMQNACDYQIIIII